MITMATKSKTDKFVEIRSEVDRLNSEAHTADQLMEGITVLLNKDMLKYNWVGFYMLEAGADPPMLVLGHY
jgi:putative methionine-R-sulfoxide reductase with GAF domain